MKITIDFEDAHLTQLLKAVHFGSWMKNATKVEEDVDAAMYEFTQYVLGKVYQGGERKRIHQKDGKYTLSEDLDQVLYEQIQEYDEDTFWDMLTYLLAERDYWQKNPGKVGKPDTETSAMERTTAIDREKAKYEKEFEDLGVERLRLVR